MCALILSFPRRNRSSNDACAAKLHGSIERLNKKALLHSLHQLARLFLTKGRYKYPVLCDLNNIERHRTVRVTVSLITLHAPSMLPHSRLWQRRLALFMQRRS
jgi:hypothetical protein